MHLTDTLIGKLITLRPLHPDDALAMFASTKDEAIKRLTGTHNTFTLSQVQQHCESVTRDKDRVDFAITLIDKPEIVVGDITLYEISHQNHSSGLRIALYNKQYFGKGIGKEAIALTLDYGFSRLKLHRIELEVYSLNPRAIHLYTQLGFEQEGIKREALYWEGKYYDALIMSIVKSE